MPKKKPIRPKNKPSHPSYDESVAVPDFADDEPGEGEGKFDRVMRGLVQVPKAELDAAIRKEHSRKGRRKAAR